MIGIKKTDQTDETQEPGEPAELIERVAALDIGKAGLTACIRVPHATKPGRRRQEIAESATTTRSLLALADWLRGHGVQVVAMEATSSYWKPVFYLLEAEGFTCWLRNARHVKHLPGRPKTDRLTRSGWPRSPSGAGAGPRWSTPARSGGFATSPAPGAP